MPPKKRLKLINNQQKITTLLAKCSGFEPESAFDRRPSDDHVADTGGADADGLEQAEETDSTNTSDPKQPDTGAQSNTDSHSQLEPNSGDSKRKFQERWSKIWPWLVFRDNKMFCSVCTKSGMQNTFTAGCETFKTSSMKRHEETADHRGAMASDNLKSCMQVAIKNVHSEHDKALIKAMKTVYWLASENLPLSKYESLMLLEKELEVPSLDCLKNGGRIDYQSYYSATEMLDAISNVIDNDISLKLKKSPFITLFADESTDISNTKRMTITARLIDPDTAVPSGVYLCNVEYEDGSGEGLASEIIKEIKKRDIPYRKVLGFGSDGASVMTGLGKGVHGRLKEINPHILNIHCMAHRLALCTSQAASSLPILKKYQEWMTQLFYYFKSSPTRESELHKVQALLESPQLKYKEIHAVRWLSFYEALDSVYRTIDPLLTYLHNRDASKDPKAKGLLKFMASTQFIYITYMMMDVIPVVSKLCLVFQKDDLDVAKAKVALDMCLLDLENYNTGNCNHDTYIGSFESDVPKLSGHFEYRGHRLTDSHTNLESLKNNFVNSLIANIKTRFPQKTLIDSFYVLAMRTINFEADLEEYGVNEIDDLLKYYGEEQVHKDTTSVPVLQKGEVKRQWRTAKQIVKSAKYPVDNMQNLWCLLVKHHQDELSELLKLVYIALTLPLHTANCERVFSQQNQILTKQRNRLSPVFSDKLLKVRMEGKGLHDHDFQATVNKWHANKNRKFKH